MDDEVRAERLHRIKYVYGSFEPEAHPLDYWMKRALLAEQQARHVERLERQVEKLEHDLARKERYIAAVDQACEMNLMYAIGVHHA